MPTEFSIVVVTQSARQSNGLKWPCLPLEISSVDAVASFGRDRWKIKGALRGQRAGLGFEAERKFVAGVDQGWWAGRVRTSLTYFERRTRNQIDFFSCFGVTSSACSQRAAQGGYYFNVGRSRATGAEAEIAAKLSDTLSISANYTNLSDIDLATGLSLARRPQNSANATVTWQPEPDLTFGVGTTYVGKRFDDALHFAALSEATKTNLFASYKLNEHFEVFGRIENLFDDRAEPAAGYGAPGRALYAGVRTSL